MPEFGQDPEHQRAKFRALVNAERDRRIAGGVIHQGRRFQTDERSRGIIDRLASRAATAIATGAAERGDHHWTGAAKPFAFIDAGNDAVPMDAFDMAALGDAVSDHVIAHALAAHELKHVSPIPRDYDEDRHWP